MNVRPKPPGRWKKGESGNPRGRRPGSGEVAKLRTAIAAHVPTIIERLTAAALQGDVGAARLLLERVIPPLKAAEQAAPLVCHAGAPERVMRSLQLGPWPPAQTSARRSQVSVSAARHKAADRQLMSAIVDTN